MVYIFTGTPDKIAVRTRRIMKKSFKTGPQKPQKKDAWHGFIERVRQGKIIEDDKERLLPLQDVAFGKITTSKILKELALQETPLQAHSLLLRLGVGLHGKSQCTATGI